MIVPELEAYVKTARARGMSDNAIRSALLAMNWERATIEEVLGGNASAVAPAAAAVSPTASVSGPAGARNKSWQKFAIIGIVAVLVLGGGAFAYSFFLKQQEAAPVEMAVIPEVVPMSNEPTSTVVVATTTVATTTIATTTPSSTPTAPPVVVPKPPVGGSNNSKVAATISVQTNYQGNPLRVFVTCKVNTTVNIYGMTLFYGNEGADPQFSTAPVSRTRTFDKTYDAPGRYDLICVPTYDNSVAVSRDSVYAAKKTVVLGGYVAPSNDSIVFSFEPRTGTMPLRIVTSCTINTAGKVTSLFIGVDDPYYLKEGETYADKFVAGESNTDGVSHSISADRTLQNDFWKGEHDVYCSARLAGEDSDMILSNPIRINFQ